MSKYDSWERVRVHDSDELDNGTGRFTIKDKIRQQARQRMARHGVVDEAETVDTRLRGLRQHPHHPQASAIRWYNRFTCLSAMVSLVLGIWQVMTDITRPAHDPPLFAERAALAKLSHGGA